MCCRESRSFAGLVGDHPPMRSYRTRRQPSQVVDRDRQSSVGTNYLGGARAVLATVTSAGAMAPAIDELAVRGQLSGGLLALQDVIDLVGHAARRTGVRGRLIAAAAVQPALPRAQKQDTDTGRSARAAAKSTRWRISRASAVSPRRWRQSSSPLRAHRLSGWI